ncbi:MAG TPA: translation initiation factor IF-2 N-terminal domain-containing protein, partial [Nitrospira sp.]|nr:translation initiation factor IF-2 N-terminal domain-containing protein [Nitrospira sp.]
MAMRVYELAKKLGMENRVLIPELKKMGASVSSHSSTLDDEVVQKVLNKLGSKSKGHGTEIEGEPGAKPAGHVSHGKATAARSHDVEEPPKPDKRRILIKRRKEDEPIEAISSAPIGESERSAQPVQAITVPTPPPSPEHPGSGLVDRSLPAEESPNEISPPAPAPLVAKQEEVPAKPTIAPPTIGGPTPEPVTG